ncbi:uncharacterized protein TNCV_4393381 [Trichonephila clavipes]|nr:uncharacterized protein TNCV_4393381 [Trichonephila clavipes]
MRLFATFEDESEEQENDQNIKTSIDKIGKKFKKALNLENPAFCYFQRNIRANGLWVSWWLEHHTPDRKAWIRCPMPPNTLRVHMEYVFVKSVGQKVLWAESREQGAEEYFPLFQSHGKIVEEVTGGVGIYRPFGEFR